jgi:Cu(I)/Ag(I) efflux system periplasmic protein CusF
MKSLNTLLLSATLGLLAPLGAQATDAHHKPAAAAGAGELADAEVRKVDLEAGKITLKHGEIKSLDMPPMTMVFVVKDKALLDKLKAGDKVKFRAVSDGGKYTVTEIQPAK